MSMSQLSNIGCKVEFGNKSAKIYNTNGELIGKGDQTRSNLFYFDIEDATYLFVKIDDVWLWHMRLCHVNFDNLISVSNMKRVRGLPKLKKQQYHLGKMTKSSFKSISFSFET